MEINLDMKYNDDFLQNRFLISLFGQRTAELYVSQNTHFFIFRKISIRVGVLRKSKVGGASPLIFFKFCMNLRKYVFQKYVKYDDRRASELSRSAW